MVNIQKAAMIGCGAVGATSAFSLMQSGLFSELVLIDANQQKAEGEATDLSHGLPFGRPMKIYAGTYDDLADCYLIIITAGAAQKPDETRIDLVNKNVKIFKSIIPEIVKRNTEGILLVVSNPVDILTYVTLKLSGFPTNRVIGSGTVLDTARLKYLLGEHLQVDSRSIHAFIIGEHGDSELAVWSSANISGVDLYDYCRITGISDPAAVLRQIYESVRDAAYSIIEGKGATYYGIGMAVRRIAEAIVRDEHSVLPVSSMISGHYGVEGICLGLPSIVGRGGAEAVLDIPLSDEELTRLQSSARKMKELIEEIGA